jgi:hypothetical protein
MSKNTHRNITINDPDRWYLSYGKIRKHYVQIHSAYWSDPDFLNLSSDAKVVFLWVLNTSLRFNKPSLNICLESACGVLRCSLGTAKQLLSELESNDIISLEAKLRVSKEEKKKEEKKIEEKQGANAPASFLDDVVDLWNRNVDEFNLPRIKSLNANRKKKLIKACKDFKDIEEWKNIFTIAASKGFTGSDGRIFIPNWDYVFRNDNYMKFYEESQLEKPKQKASELVIEVESMLLKGL